MTKIGEKMKIEKNSDNVGPHWSDTVGSLRAPLLRLDGQVGAVVNAEKYVVDPGVISGGVTGHLERIAQQMGLGTGAGAVQQSDSAPGFEPIKPGFTREAGSFRRQVPPHEVRDVGE